MDGYQFYEELSKRTNGNIYIGVVGPVRTGKSTFIKRFMETLVIPQIENVYVRERARDELPQSGSGKTIMTAEPKFVPEEAVSLCLSDHSACSVRMIDSVGFMVDGALGEFEEGSERLVTTPWFDHEVTLREAAETGTRKVITDHSTIGIVVTTDGTISELPREAYLDAERKTILAMQDMKKPFVVLINSAQPEGSAAREVSEYLVREYQITGLRVNCLELDEPRILQIIRNILYEFSPEEYHISLPQWVDVLPVEHPVRNFYIKQLSSELSGITKMKELDSVSSRLQQCEEIQEVSVEKLDLSSGTVFLTVILPPTRFYQTISQQTGLSVLNEGDMMKCFSSLAFFRKKYEKIAKAMDEVTENGYAIVSPDEEDLSLLDPEVAKQSGKYTIRLKATAPALHLIRTDLDTTVSPTMGNEKMSGSFMQYALQECDSQRADLWDTEMFGKSMHTIALESIQAKSVQMSPDIRHKIQNTIQRISNEDSNGVICIII